MKLQNQQCTGRFVDIENEHNQHYIDCAARHHNTDSETIISMLKKEEFVQMGTDWYDKLRIKPAPRKPAPPVPMVKCDCGHYVPQGTRMSASLGTTCPECYDKFSD